MYFHWQPVAEPGRPFVLFSAETPLSMFPTFGRVAKQQLERLHLDRYATDMLLATGSRPFGKAIAGADPPDFVVESPSGQMAIDCIQFAIEGRRQVHALFRALRDAVLADDPARFSHLAGLQVYLWVVDKTTTDLALPPRHTNLGFVAALADRLATFRFDPSKHRIPGVGPLPDNVAIETEPVSGECVFYATPLSHSFPLSPFFSRTGFEIGFAYPTSHARDQSWEQLASKLRDHDKPTNEEVLVTVGGPASDGLVFPSEHILFDFLMQEPPAPHLALKHVRRVVAHSWDTGAVAELFPEFRLLTAGAHQRLITSHHPTRAHPVESTRDGQ